MEIFSKILRFITAPLDFLMKYFKLLVLLVFILLIVGLNQEETPQKANLAKLYLRGAIFESESFEKQIEEIKKNPNIKGVLLIIDSPGGSVGASIEIANMIKDLRDKMTVIAHVEGSMASGSYYAGMYSDKIIANRGSLIGSIGIIINGYNIKPLLDKIGIKEQTLQEGEYKTIGTMMREWTPKEREYLQNFLKKQYNLFVNDVLDTRSLSDTNPKAFAEGKIFTAKEALELKLIDKIGSRSEAIAELAEIAQVKEPIFLEKSKTEQLIDKLSNASLSVFSNLLRGQIQ
ncbi:signal peptide peptidase SppA [Helicobacter brantae]|uniref:Signal peptide peptidase SppA n=1 Tax=Helicobacter brantae TaxID=375927 RepID=A0A3D8J0R6_9HELI|nr:signal peptide peptidase SppA [Helicobacter brantae]RDU70765.1 signal peptide peptidase SppA [Helicobacter brantae]